MARSRTHSVPWSEDPDHVEDHQISDDEFQTLMKVFERKRRRAQQMGTNPGPPPLPTRNRPV